MTEKMVLEPSGGSWRPLGASWGGKVRQESGFDAKKFWASTPRAREGRGRIEGGSGDIQVSQSAWQRPPGERIRGGGQWPIGEQTR